MTTREKIIVGIMTVTVIGGGIYFAMPSRSDSAPSPATAGPDISAIVAKVQTGMRQPELTNRERHLLEMASSDRHTDPFRSRALAPAKAPEKKEEPEVVELPAYTAFIKVGANTLAIIDGHEYRREQSLTTGEYRVLGIYPDRVELVRQGTSDPVLVPIAEEQHNREHR